MTWEAHRRDEVLREAMTIADRRRDGALPWADLDGARKAFGQPAELVGALQMRWHTRLSGAIERELTEQPWDLQQAVVHAWRGLAADMPGVRAILDAEADEEFMRRARRKEWTLLATASGLTGMADPQAVRIGQEVEQRARAVTVQKTLPAAEPTHRADGGWLTRLRHALAA
ncbi:MAG: hypothetical protein M3211_11215 [Actinomycetota bacterium]|nr:hypothetical protein [Actinomycetota bacterium]